MSSSSSGRPADPLHACVIFNPAARGEKARRFRAFLDALGPQAVLKPTTGPGAARALAREAVAQGHSLLLAAGGDGTVFEVLNGIADAPDGLARTTLGVLPLGTANILAHELRVPLQPDLAWNALRQGSLRQVDCGIAQFVDPHGQPCSARFAVVAGAGLDARAVQLVDLRLKRSIGKAAYALAALKALRSFPDQVRCTLAGKPFQGRAVLAGNGRLYAGDIPIFGDGRLDSGRLHVRGVVRVSPALLARCLLAYLTRQWPMEGRLPADTVEELRLESDRPVPLQLDGEFVGWLPATVRVAPAALRLLVPP